MKKISFIFITIILSSLLIKAQTEYPVQTILKGDSVVILRRDQAIGINDMLKEKESRLEFQKIMIERGIFYIGNLKDSLNKLNWKLNVTQADLGRKLAKSQDTLNSMTTSLANAKERILFYEKEMKRIEKLEWTEKKARTHMKVGIGAVIVTWIVLIITAVK